MDPEQIPLRDLHLPADVGWWPLAPGWWVLVGAVLLGIGWLLYKALLNWRITRARRAALKQLSFVTREYRHHGDAVALAIELSELLRRLVLAYAPRRAVAGLTGERWLECLDRGLDEPLFASGPGRCIESLPYRRRGRADADVDGLLAAVRTRIKTPLAGATG